MSDSSELHDANESPDEIIGLAPPEATDPLIEAFKKDVDRTLLIENLRLTPEERSRKFLRSMESIYELRRAAQRRTAARDKAR